ncbi:hypothetical protein [Fusibacter bizertensis]
MITNSVNPNKNTSAYTNYKTDLATNQVANTLPEELKSADKTNTPTDTIELGNNSSKDFGTYKIDRQKLNELKLDFQKNTSSFKEMVKNLIEKQGKNYNQVISNASNGKSPIVKIDDETKANAAESISENGYWGVNKTSERILEFAKTLSGGDASKINTLKNAFKEGFEKAKEAFGGTLPDISQQTYDKVMQGFDEWENPTQVEEVE